MVRNRNAILTIIVVAAAVLLTSVVAIHAQAPTTFTLDEAQRLALGRYELVSAAREQVQQARLTRRLAGSLVLPTVSVNSVVTRNFVTQAFSFGGRTIEVLPPADYNVALIVQQPIFAGLRDLKARRQADLGIELASQAFGATAQDALLEVTRAYYRVLGAQENVAISSRALSVAEETLRAAESLYRAGEAVETAVLRARVAHSDARRELLEGENGLALARQYLALIAGTDDDFTVARPPRPAALAQPLEALIETGIKTRPELRALDLQREIGELEIEKRRGQSLPVVRAEGTYIRRRSSFPSNQLSSVAINATWTVFDGGRARAEVAAARSELRETELRRELLKKQTAQQIRGAYLNVTTLSASVDMLTAQVEFARRNTEATSRAYRVGEATDLDVLEANTTLARSERQLSMASYSFEVALYELERAVGTFAADRVGTARAAGGEQ